MKILSVSLGRNGTQSLNKFLNENGINSIHGCDYFKIKTGSYSEDLAGIINYFESLAKKADSFIDIPYCFIFEYFLNKYPDAKFIYIKRELESWITSMNNIKKIWPHEDPYIFEQAYCNMYIKTGKSKIEDLSDVELSIIWEKHDEKIKKILYGNPNFIEIDLLDPEIGEKLSKFLGIKRLIDFPKINTIEDLRASIDHPDKI